MLVQELLEAKSSEVVTARPSMTLAEAARTLTTRHIGALVVTDDAERMLGIVSERDLTRAIEKYAAGLFDRRVEDIMTRTVVTCSLEDSVVEALYLMNSKGFRHLPVLDRETLVGIVSVRDITGEWLKLLEQENQQLRDEIGTQSRRSA